MSSRRVLFGLGLPVMALVLLVLGARLCDPWRHWRLPAVEVPSPNAFDDFKQAGELVNDHYSADSNPADDAALRRQVVAENAEALRLLRAGFDHAYVEPRTDAWGPSPKYYQHCRSLARVLSYEAAEKAAEGRYAAAIDSQLDAERVGFDVARRANLMGRLVGIAARTIGRGEKNVQPRIDHLTAAEARAAEERLADLIAGEQSFAQTLIDDRDLTLGLLTSGYRSGDYWELGLMMAKSDSPRVAWPLAVFGPVPWLSGYRRYMDAGVAWSKLPWLAAPPPRLSRLFAPGSYSAPDLGKQRVKCLQADASDQMFLAALALQAWRAEHGRYPDSLDALAPDILPVVPADPFGRGPLKYRLEGDKYVLYSVGPDGVDDGGQPAVARDDKGQWRYNARDLASRGDLVWVTSAVLDRQPRP
jgi:hypothetical protein